MTDDMAAENTDREIYREREDDYYADSIHVTAAGGIGLNVGGEVVVKPLRDWFALAEPPKSVTNLHLDLEDLQRKHEKWLIGTDDDAEMAQEWVMENLPALIAELQRMREALGWYADRENYVDGPSISKTVYAPYYPILDDEGQRARAALNKGGEGDE
jgi:hypothetical protein